MNVIAAALVNFPCFLGGFRNVDPPLHAGGPEAADQYLIAEKAEVVYVIHLTSTPPRVFGARCMFSEIRMIDTSGPRFERT